MNFEDMSMKAVREYLDGGGAFITTSEDGMDMRMWGAGHGCYVVLLTPQQGNPACSAACGLENVLSDMTRWADLSAWTKAE